MLGKRFRRTTSMSHLGPWSPVAGSAGAGDPEPDAVMQDATNLHTFPCRTARPLLLEAPVYTGYGGRSDDAHLAGAVELLGGLVPTALQKQRPCPMEEVCCAVDVVCEEMSIEGMGWSDKGDQGKSMVFSAISNSRLAVHGSDAVAGGLAGGYGSPVAHPMVIWPRSSFHAGQGNARGDQASPAGFLDVCFYCKRRLRQERDIYMYRGDTAFCSEECRHRQIMNDEQRAARVSSSSSRRGGAARPRSETAVAA